MAQRKIDVVLDSVKRLLRIGATANLLNLLQKQHPADLAQIFSELPDKEREAAFTLLAERNSRLAMEALQRARARGGRRAARRRARPKRSPSSLQEIPSDDAAALIDYLPEELSARGPRPDAAARNRASVENLLEYDEQTAGRIMNPKVFALSRRHDGGRGDHRAAGHRATSRWSSISTSSTSGGTSSASSRCAGCCWSRRRRRSSGS